MCVYTSSITKEQRTASGTASITGTDREGFDKVKGVQDLYLFRGKTGKHHSIQYRAQCASLPYSLKHESIPLLVYGAKYGSWRSPETR